MGRHLEPWRHMLIRDMLRRKRFTTSQIADAAECSERSIRNIRSHLIMFGTESPPVNPGGRPRSITPPMLEALFDHLIEKPGLYLDEMAVFLYDEFDITVSPPSIKRALSSAGWTKKTAHNRAQERNRDLRDFYFHKLSEYQSYQLVYVDESGCDKRIGFRRTGWSPLGIRPVQVAKFHRGQRYQISPAYAQDGILLSRVFAGSTDAVVFEDFIAQLLQHCGRWPEPKSVLIMDNASFHHSEKITEMCFEAGVRLLYLPPYSPDLNPIEEFFSELKSYIKRNWKLYEAQPDHGFDTFLQDCVDTVGAKKASAEAHFRHSGVTIEEFREDA